MRHFSAIAVFISVLIILLGPLFHVETLRAAPSPSSVEFPLIPIASRLEKVTSAPVKWIKRFIGLRSKKEEEETSLDGEDAKDHWETKEGTAKEIAALQNLEVRENQDPWLKWPLFSRDLLQEYPIVEEDPRGFLANVFDTEKVTHDMISPYQAMVDMPYTVDQFKHASGNWLGVRDLMDNHGAHFSTTYTSDFAGNPVGGEKQGFTYLDSFALGLLLDMEKISHLKGLHILMSGVQGDGQNLSKNYIHNIFNAQQAEKGQVYKWYELSTQQNFWHDQADIKIGRFGATDDFEISPLYWLYMNNAIDGRVLGFRLNSHLPANPLASWGARLKVNTTKETVARAGIFQINAHPSVNGLNWNFYPDDGLGLIAQFSWNPEFPNPLASRQIARDKSQGTLQQEEKRAQQEKAMPKGMPGHYFAGGYYSSFNYPNFHNPKTTTPYGYGLYAHADQMVYRPNPFTDQGLIVWSATNFSPQQDIALLPFQINGGTAYTGLIPGRPSDFTILGTGYGMISDQFAEATQQRGKGYPTYEWMLEFGYRVHYTEFAYFQPDLQYIINPSGTGEIPNALVVGAQVGIIF